jgi:dTDP-4-amino-4,6-dideoxygalactose transaminase
MQLMNIPILDLKAQYATIRQEIVPAILDVLESQNLCNGPAVRQFETQLAVYCQCSSALGLSSGTDALLLALMALDIGPGDEVITTPFTFFATAGVIWRVGARPVFVDIEPETFNIDATKIEAAITPKTKAIMPVHLYGQMADMDAIMAIAHKHNLPVIEDAAQAVGSEYKGRRAGSIGAVGCYSFYVTKNLGAMGDAGAVTTNDPQLAIKMEKMRIHGMSDQYYHKWVGGNFRMDSIQAVSLSVKMRHLEGWTENAAPTPRSTISCWLTVRALQLRLSSQTGDIYIISIFCVCRGGMSCRRISSSRGLLRAFITRWGFTCRNVLPRLVTRLGRFRIRSRHVKRCWPCRSTRSWPTSRSSS